MSVSDTNAVSVEFHALALVKSTLGASNLYDIVLKAIERNFLLVEEQAEAASKPLKTFVFYPVDLKHFIGFVYPLEKAFDGKTDLLFSNCSVL